MKTPERMMAEEIGAYCAVIGTDPLLIQGPGGNVSWKDGEVLWVKASGTWLANAEKEEIFIPIDLAHLMTEIAKKNFLTSPKVIGNLALSPSIETMLHALMPQRVVVHLHAVTILAHLVRDNFLNDFKSLLDETISWAAIDYFKPGVALATEIYATLLDKPSVNVVFLKNHGVVIGGADITEVNKTLNKLIQALNIEPAYSKSIPNLISKPPKNLSELYIPIADMDIQQLALNPNLFKRLSTDWALYPDHIVFLGSKAYTYPNWGFLIEQNNYVNSYPDLVFIYGMGVYAKNPFTKAKQAQLRCYFDVIIRQKSDNHLVVLPSNQIAELLKWDAEQYRISFAK